VHPAEAFKYFRELHNTGKECVLESSEISGSGSGIVMSAKVELEMLELPG
jgi:hypothetical protein